MNVIFLALPGNEELTLKLKNIFGGEPADFILRNFPDEETYLQIKSNLEGKTCIVVCSLDRPDSKIIPLYYIAKLCKEFKASKVILVAPYLSYMRQDTKFNPGEAVTSAYFAQLLSQWFDGLITIDPHLHRHHDMAELYTIPCTVIHAAPVIADWISKNIEKPVLIGPDIESRQWVSEVAQKLNIPFIILSKSRIGDKEVKVTIPLVENFMDHTPVLMDDIISTARTMIESINQLKKGGMKPITVIGVHAVFAGNAYEELKAAGAGQVITCNSIKHPSNRIDLSQLIDIKTIV
ncbi:MAG: ribose-phosphate pyrophosphokinase [Bacteroidia bacterium]